MDTILRDELFSVCTQPQGRKQKDLFLHHSKHHLLASLNDVYCAHFHSKNVWLLRKFYQGVKGVEEERNKERAMEQWHRVLNLLHHSGVRKTDLTKLPVEEMEIQRAMYAHAFDFEEVVFWKDKMVDRMYACLTFVYRTAFTGESIPTALQVILYLHQQKHADVFTTKSDMCMADVLWKLLSSVVDQCSSQVSEFYLLSRDLYYYKLRKKEREGRLNYLLMTFLVIAQRDVQEIAVDTGEEERSELLQVAATCTGSSQQASATRSKSACTKPLDYLYHIFEYDTHLKNEIQRECEYNKRQERKKKGVVVDKLPGYMEKRSVDVVKLSL